MSTNFFQRHFYQDLEYANHQPAGDWEPEERDNLPSAAVPEVLVVAVVAAGAQWF